MSLRDIMITLPDFETPQEMARLLAQRCRDKRLFLDLSQKSLSARSGVSTSVIKQFENIGKISLESLLKIALALGALGDFRTVFKPDSMQGILTLDDLLKEPKKRKRGRQ